MKNNVQKLLETFQSNNQGPAVKSEWQNKENPAFLNKYN